MKYDILSLRDIKANNYHPPIFVANIAVTLRDLGDMVNDPNGKEAWQKHPEDFELWHIGEWDSELAWFYTKDSINDQDHDEPFRPKQLLALSTLKAN